jgi:PhoPQ-activated pathogenicity-related protein
MKGYRSRHALRDGFPHAEREAYDADTSILLQEDLRMNRFFSFCVLSLATFLIASSPARADLLEYVKKADDSFAWKLKEKIAHPSGDVYDLHLVSQTWQGIKWEHQLQVYVPTGVKPTATIVLWNQGGKASPTSIILGMEMAKKANAPVAFLYGIPNQPLFDGKKEDALIAETFVRYLKSDDESWPLLFPMVKSLTKAMDALQAFAQREWNFVIRFFVVTGGSKRGWTTWLTAAVEPRVKAIAPLVIDTLNMQAQLPHQLKSYGRYSEMIDDYVKRDLVPMPKTQRAVKLWSMVDPWVYRDKLTMPTMIINGANDPYWTVDALNLYWSDLKSPRWIEYVPNAGHNLLENKFDPTRVANTLGAFARHQIHGVAMPKLTWKHDDHEGKPRLTVQSDPMPKKARLWVADGEKRDVRKSTWKEQPAMINETKIVGTVDGPNSGHRVFYGEMEYQIDGMTFYLSTQVRVLEKK